MNKFSFFEEKFLKKFFLFFILFFNQCILFDVLDLSVPESVNGKEAKNMIFTAALTGTVIAGNIDRSFGRDALFTFLSDRLAGVNDSAYYDKKDVEQCAADAQLINLLTIKIGGITCNLKEKEHKFLINWPVPIL